MTEPDDGRRGKENSFRFDVVTEVLSANDETGEVELFMRPDPRRYEWRDKGSEQLLYDKFDNMYFPRDVFRQFAEQLRNLPITYEVPRIKDAQEYTRGRRMGIAAMLDGSPPVTGFADKSETFLEALAGDRLGFVVLSIDIVGSTALATSEHADGFHHLVIPTFLFELSEIVPLFNGHVLKYTGDGLIAYFPEPSFMRKNDLALDCALTMHGLVYRVLNPELTRRGLPELEVRTGIDAGDAFVEVIGSAESKRHADIIGVVVSLATKIQTRAEPGGICLGEIAVRNLHTEWRQGCRAVEPLADWTYTDSQGNSYPYYQFLGGARNWSVDRDLP